MVQKKLVIFDFDGVLRSFTMEMIYIAYHDSIADVGKNPDDFFTDMESFLAWYNVDWHWNEVKIFGTRVYEPNPEFDKLFHLHFDRQTHLFPWVEEVLKTLSQKYTLAVFSSSRTFSILESLGPLASYFSQIVGCEKVRHLKPSPEGIFLLCNEFEVPAKDALMIGDMPVDIIAGKSAGAKTGAVAWGFIEKSVLVSNGPDYFFESPEDLLALSF